MNAFQLSGPVCGDRCPAAGRHSGRPGAGGNAAMAPAARPWRSALLAACLLAAPLASADDALTGQLTAFMQQQYTPPPAALEVVIRTPSSQRLSCERPQFSLPSRSRNWGNLSIAVVCGSQKRYIQAEVRVTDRYLIAASPIAAGQTVTSGDIAWRTGRLDQLSSLPLRNMPDAVGTVSERAIGSGQPLTAAMLRRPWLVKNGQQVQVSALGEGFTVQSSGKAMNNAAANDPVRIRMDSGQIVNGRLMPDGSVHVVL
ncbi:flagellar basal body P-ring formation chaperone FlgA [Sodalis ligni]|nr:flagellar basal body P-ring formation chaperone FlgA [Sodalis ligni]